MDQTAPRLSPEHQYAGYIADYERLRAEDAPLFVHQMRARAFNRFIERGFPVTRELSFPEREDWLFTNVAAIARTPYRTALQADHVDDALLDPYTFGATDWPRLVFVDGIFQPALSRLAPFPKGVVVERLATAFTAHPALIQPLLGQKADVQKSGFTALNTAFLSDGALISIPAGKMPDAPVHVMYVSTGAETPALTHPRTLITLGDGSAATVIESYVGISGGQYLTNAVTEIYVGQHANLDHYRIDRENREASHVSTTEIWQAQDSHVSTFNMSMGGTLTRNDTNARLDGERAVIRMNGLYLVAGQQHVDNHTMIEHRKPDCDSYEVYKGILAGVARAVFNGKVYVHREAQNTDAKQLNKNLLLSPGAGIHTKPQLEIHADQVKCTHGATVGQLDEEQVFYLRTRGLPRDSACHLLTYGFAGDLIRRLKVEAVRRELDSLFEGTIQQLVLAQSTV